MDKDWASRQTEFACESFDSGQYNDIMLAYLLEAMKQVKVPDEMGKNILMTVHQLLDDTTAQEILRKHYRVGGARK